MRIPDKSWHDKSMLERKMDNVGVGAEIVAAVPIAVFVLVSNVVEAINEKVKKKIAINDAAKDILRCAKSVYRNKPEDMPVEMEDFPKKLREYADDVEKYPDLYLCYYPRINEYDKHSDSSYAFCIIDEIWISNDDHYWGSAKAIRMAADIFEKDMEKVKKERKENQGYVSEWEQDWQKNDDDWLHDGNEYDANELEP